MNLAESIVSVQDAYDQAPSATGVLIQDRPALAQVLDAVRGAEKYHPAATLDVTCDWDADAYELMGDKVQDEIIAAISIELAKQIAIVVSPQWLVPTWGEKRVSWNLKVFIGNARADLEQPGMRDIRDMEAFAERIANHQMVIEEIFSERKRQVENEGWTLEHDNEHSHGELADAAACYALGRPRVEFLRLWPWTDQWWKPADRRRDLIKAAALLVAEIERLDRRAAVEQS